MYFLQVHMCACAKPLQSSPTLRDPMYCSLPVSSVHGISQQEYWSGLLCSPSGDLPNHQQHLENPIVHKYQYTFQFPNTRVFLVSILYLISNNFLNFLFCIGVQLINNAVIVSGEQQRDSAIHIHVSILPQTPIQAAT